LVVLYGRKKRSLYGILLQDFPELHEQDQRETCVQLVFLPRNEWYTFWVQCRSNYFRENVLVIDRN